jgi:hypothetical protein
METPPPTPPEQTPPQQPPPPATPPSAAPHPVTLSVDYPDRALDRLTSFFRIFTVIPILVVVATLGVGILFIPTGLMIVFREKYPRWWYDWHLNVLRFQTRIGAYALLMNDRYPSTDEEQSVHLDFPYPKADTELNRWLPLVKWFLAIPHYVVLVFLFIGVLVAAIVSWFAILFTGRYPRGLFDYIEGVMRWHNRVMGYAFTLVTDRYPPFSLSA